MMVLEDGQVTPILQGGQPITLNLLETEPNPGQVQRSSGEPPFSSTKEKRQAGPNSNCMCEWQN